MSCIGGILMRIQYLLCASLLLCGCAKVSDLTEQKSKSPEKAPTTTKKTNKIKVIDCKNDSSQQVTFETKGDKIQKMTQKFTMSFSDLGITEDMNSEQIQSEINSSLDDKYNSIEGVHVSTQLSDQQVEVTLEMDFKKANIDTLIENKLLDEGEAQSDYVSLKKTQNVFKNEGYACITK